MGILGSARRLRREVGRDGVTASSHDDWPTLHSRRGSSLRRRFVVAITALVGVVLVVLALALGLSSRQRLQSEIEAHARSYARLAVGPFCRAYETYFDSGHSKFLQLVDDLAELSSDLVAVEIYDTTGRVLYSTGSLRESTSLVPVARPDVVSEDPRVRAAARGLDSVAWRTPRPVRYYTVMEPHVEEWGRHRYSVAFHFTYDSLGAVTQAFLVSLVVPTTLSLGIGLLIAILLARQSLSPLEKLIAGARDIGSGRLDRRIELTSDDEFEDLASTLNRMAARLAGSIVELEESNLALQQSNVELKELDRLKSDLLANVSHELRTPLTSMQGYTEAMAEGLLGPVNRGQEEALEVCQRNLDRLLTMIGELLTFSRLESDRLAMQRRAVDLTEVARSTVEAVRSARGVGRELVESFGEGPFVVDIDPERIGQVIENLLTNAVKFTPEGGRIELRLVGEAETVCVEVADQGIGIEPLEQSRVFDRFYQVESSSTRRYGGIGLGLSIVKQILDAHGCGIELESQVGVGTTFRFRLPRAVEESDRDLPLVRVLVVDPDAAFARQLTAEIERCGWGWRVVPSAQAAKLTVQEGEVDAVILDRLLPDGDAFDLVREWRSQDATRGLPVVVVSERSDQPVAEGLGAIAFLAKPVPAGVVAKKLRRQLEPSSARCILLVADQVDRELRETSRSLRPLGFWWRRWRDNDSTKLLVDGDLRAVVLFDRRRSPLTPWGSVVPLVLAASLPVIVWADAEHAAEVRASLADAGIDWGEVVSSRRELRQRVEQLRRTRDGVTVWKDSST